MWKITRPVKWVKFDVPYYRVTLRYTDLPNDEQETMADICQWYLEGQPEIKKYDLFISKGKPIVKTFTCKKSARRAAVRLLKMHK